MVPWVGVSEATRGTKKPRKNPQKYLGLKDTIIIARI
jgi:hypothetical protein